MGGHDAVLRHPPHDVIEVIRAGLEVPWPVDKDLVPVRILVLWSRVGRVVAVGRAVAEQRPTAILAVRYQHEGRSLDRAVIDHRYVPSGDCRACEIVVTLADAGCAHGREVGSV